MATFDQITSSHPSEAWERTPNGGGWDGSAVADVDPGTLVGAETWPIDDTYDPATWEFNTPATPEGWSAESSGAVLRDRGVLGEASDEYGDLEYQAPMMPSKGHGACCGSCAGGGACGKGNVSDAGDPWWRWNESHTRGPSDGLFQSRVVRATGGASNVPMQDRPPRPVPITFYASPPDKRGKRPPSEQGGLSGIIRSRHTKKWGQIRNWPDPKGGNFGSGDVGSVDVNPSITIKRDRCSATIFIHLWINPTFAAINGCTNADVQEFLDRASRAVDKFWRDKICPCDTEDERNEYCRFSVVLVFHSTRAGAKDENGKPVLPMQIRLDCGREGGRYYTDPGAGFMDFRGGAGASGATLLDTLLAHELGHNVFGFGERPEGWDDEMHNPEAASLMHKGPVRKEDRLSQKEICLIVKRLKLCELKVCCPIGRAFVALAQPQEPLYSIDMRERDSQADIMFQSAAAIDSQFYS